MGRPSALTYSLLDLNFILNKSISHLIRPEIKLRISVQRDIKQTVLLTRCIHRSSPYTLQQQGWL